jgi:hypothetical protein
MKKLVLITLQVWLSAFLVILPATASITFTLGTIVHAAEFFCSSGDVTCLIAKINSANGMPGQHTINLEPGIYTLQAVDNGGFNGNGLPVISGSTRIQATAEDLPTVIERDPNAPAFRIFDVSASGELHLDGITVLRAGNSPFISFIRGSAILNSGVTSLENSIVTDSTGDFGAINNFGTLRVIRSIIADNSSQGEAGGIVNQPGGSVLVENSTIARNHSQGAGGILNEGSLVVKNSAIIFNTTDAAQPGGGIQNNGSAEIINTTIAKNRAGGLFFEGAGGGVWNGFGAQISIINSTIRENIAGFFLLSPDNGGGIVNEGGIVRVQNTIVAGNSTSSPFAVGQDCFGTITSLGNNLIGDPSGCTINLQPSDLTGDPGLGSLVEIGEDDSPGKAFYPVLAGSAVIDRGNPNACLQTDQLGLLRIGICDIGAVEFRGPMLISVDVRPRSDANRINPSSTKNINVAILSANGFDATGVDPNTVRFGATGAEAAPIHVGLRDVDGDGDRDMLVRFQIPDTGIKCGDTSASLTGQSSNGVSFIGSSSIKTVQCTKH